MSQSVNYSYNGVPLREAKRVEKEQAPVGCVKGGRFITLKEAAGWACMILFLSLVDGVFTLVQVERGAVELNPFMSYLLSEGEWIFLLSKSSLSLFSLAVLFVYLPRYRLCRFVFGAIAAVYSVVFCYHLFGFLR